MSCNSIIVTLLIVGFSPGRSLAKNIIVGSETYQIGNTYQREPRDQVTYGSYTDQIEGEDEELTAQPHGIKTSVYGDRTLIAALTVQKNNTYITSPSDRNIYGSVIQVKNNVYDSPDSHKPSGTRTRIVSARGGPGSQGISYVISGDFDLQAQPNQKQQTGQEKAIMGSETVQTDNTSEVSPGSKNYFGSYTYQEGNTYGEPGDQDKYGSITVQTNNNYQPSPGSTNYYGSYTYQKGNTYIGEPGDQDKYGSITVQTNNTYQLSPGSTNYLGSHTYQEGNVYRSGPKS